MHDHDAHHPDGQAASTPLHSIIMGSGFAGLGMAIALRRAGITDFVLLEREPEVGGVWRDNGYPGAACDVPSHLYSFSFEPNPAWSHRFARRDEIFAYLQHCADKYELRRHLRLGAEVAEARLDELLSRWVVHLTDGRCFTAERLISATGQLSLPSMPVLPGQVDFRGPAFHSARWDHQVTLDGKRVAVIGTGASAIQLVPAIAGQARQIHLFQRSAAYLMPRSDRAIPAWEKKLFRALPWTMKLLRLKIYCVYESRAIALTRFTSLLQVFAGLPFRRLLRRQVKDPVLRARLTPDYPIGCKRVLLSDDFFPALNRPDVSLHSQAIRRMTADGIETVDGQRHAVDAIIYATGFAATKFLSPIRVVGRDGVDLNQAWRDGAQAWLGMTVPGFPNFFVLYGPNTNLGHNSIIYMLESQIAHVMRVLDAMRARRAEFVEIDRARFERYNRKLHRRLRGTAWNGCNSWYVDAAGHSSTNWPGFTLSYRWLTRHASLDNYRFSAMDRGTGAITISAPGGWYERAQATFLRGFLRVVFRSLIGPPLGARAQRAVVNALAWLMPGGRGTKHQRQTINGVPTEQVSPDSGGQHGVILYLHGGAFCLGHPRTHRAITTRLAVAADATVWVPDYRLAPEHPFPAALDDALHCYRGLLARGHRPEQIVLAGDSAGGALALALALRLKQQQQPAPAGLLLLSPVTDPSLGGSTLRSQARLDPMLRLSWVMQGVKWLAAPAHEPALCPLEQDLAGLPPMLIQVGEREILLADATRLAAHARSCEVPCQLEIYAERWHVFQLQSFHLPSATRAIRTLGQFARDCMDKGTMDKGTEVVTCE